MTMCPLGIMSTPLVISMTVKVRYMTLRALIRSDTQPPSGRSSEAGKMNVAVSRAAVHRSTPKLST